MANGRIAASTAVGGATGAVAGPIGAAAGAVAGYLSSSDAIQSIFGGKKKPAPVVVPWYKRAETWEIAGVIASIVGLVYLNKRK